MFSYVILKLFPVFCCSFRRKVEAIIRLDIIEHEIKFEASTVQLKSPYQENPMKITVTVTI